jgi:hypothetical protein
MRNWIAALTAVVLITSTSFAQERGKPAANAATKPEPKAAAADPGQPINIKLDLTITDQAGPGDAATKRTVSMIVADRQMGSVRSSGRVVVGPNNFNVGLNLDAEPFILNENQIRLTLALDYSPKPGTENATSGEGRANLTERLTLWVQPGKPIVISHASDPTSDRKITAELVTTLLK